MKPVIMDGKALSQKIKDYLKKKIDAMKLKPCLAVVLVGDDPASVLYTNLKAKACTDIGIISEKHILPRDIPEPNLLKLISELNSDKRVHGILVQLPLPPHINEFHVLEAVNPIKDVDGFSPLNMGRVFSGRPYLSSCTAAGIMSLFEEYRISLSGKNVCIVGCSEIVGKPLTALCINEGATVTVCNAKTRKLKDHTHYSDVVISATGVPSLIKRNMVKRKAIIVDVGTTKVDGVIKGDVDFDKVKSKCSYITPVPGGVGPMTIAMLMKNTFLAYKTQVK